MDWEAIGAIGEAVGAVALVVTLIYLATQIRQNTVAQETTSVWLMTQIFNQSHVSILENDEVAHLAAQAKQGEFQSELEQTRAYSLLMLILNGYSAAWRAHKHGHLPDAEYAVLQRDCEILNVPGFKPLLDEALAARDPEFVRDFFREQAWALDKRCSMDGVGDSE